MRNIIQEVCSIIEEVRSHGYFSNLDPDPGLGPRTLDPDPEKPGPWKTWALKSLDPEKHGKQLDMEKWLEDHILYNLLTLKIC